MKRKERRDNFSNANKESRKGDSIRNTSYAEAATQNASNLIKNNSVDIPRSLHRLKNNKGAGHDDLSAELFNAGSDKLVGCMH